MLSFLVKYSGVCKIPSPILNTNLFNSVFSTNWNPKWTKILMEVCGHSFQSYFNLCWGEISVLQIILKKAVKLHYNVHRKSQKASSATLSSSSVWTFNFSHDRNIIYKVIEIFTYFLHRTFSLIIYICISLKTIWFNCWCNPQHCFCSRTGTNWEIYFCPVKVK